MSRFRMVPALVFVAMALPAGAAAQDGGFRASLLDDLAALEQKYSQLAEAVPAEDYGWSPMEGVRSVAQVYAHVANANYMFSGMLGHERPQDIGVDNAPRNLEELTDKASITTALKNSFPHVRELITSMSDDQLDEEMTLFGQETTVRSTLLLVMTHMHEHLGQSIAYARSVGVVPPWSS
jgi:uncharacterized damage-inducible protein DinB